MRVGVVRRSESACYGIVKNVPEDASTPQRRSPPRCLVKSEALTYQLPPPMWMGCVVRILSAASRDVMRLSSITLDEKGTLMVVPVYPWSDMVRWELLGRLGL